MNQQHSTTLREISLLFLRMGFTAFGGPAAHIAMFREEVVTRRGWLTDDEFLDLWGATNLIPGPSSTEMALHIGLSRAGWRGLLMAGLCFILPAVGIVLIFAVLYMEYGTTPAAEGMLYGIKPVVVVIILQALWGLGKKALKTPFLMAVALVTFGLYLLGISELALMFGSGLLVMLVRNIRRTWQTQIMPFFFLVAMPDDKTPYSLAQLFLTFLKIGALLYGSGYVLLAFLQSNFVDRLGWLTQQQLLDAVAIGQFTPGPLFTTATFVGYIVGGMPGAVVATIGIFLPSFVVVLITHPLIPKIRHSVWLGALLDGVNVAAIGLMAGVCWQLGRVAVMDGLTVIICLISAVLLLGYKVNSTWLILGGAGVGLLWHAIP